MQAVFFELKWTYHCLYSLIGFRDFRFFISFFKNYIKRKTVNFINHNQPHLNKDTKNKSYLDLLINLKSDEISGAVILFRTIQNFTGYWKKDKFLGWKNFRLSNFSCIMLPGIIRRFLKSHMLKSWLQS